MRLSLLGVSALFLTNCAAGPGRLPSAAEITFPPAFRFAPDATAKTNLASLLPIADPAYQALTQAALANAPTVGAALARVDAARAQSRRAGAERFPVIDGSLSTVRSRSSTAEAPLPPLPGLEIDRDRSTFGANLTARWDADLFGGLRASQRAARARIDAADADVAAVRLALLAEIAGSVTDWRTLSAREARLLEDLAASRRLVELADERERAGLSPGIDRVLAQALAASSQFRLVTLAADRAGLIGRLITLTARPAETVERALSIAAPPQPLLPPPPALPSTLLANRPDVLAAGARLRAADAEVAAAAAARFPKLTLSSALGILALGIGGILDGEALSGSVAAGISGPLLDFGRIAADIDRAEAATLEAFANLRGAIFLGLGDVEASYALVAARDRELSATLDGAMATQRAARLTETRQQAGLSSFVQVLDARRLSIAAGERAAIARGQAARARIDLWQALGGG